MVPPQIQSFDRFRFYLNGAEFGQGVLKIVRFRQTADVRSLRNRTSIR